MWAFMYASGICYFTPCLLQILGKIQGKWDNAFQSGSSWRREEGHFSPFLVVYQNNGFFLCLLAYKVHSWALSSSSQWIIPSEWEGRKLGKDERMPFFFFLNSAHSLWVALCHLQVSSQYVSEIQTEALLHSCCTISIGDPHSKCVVLLPCINKRKKPCQDSVINVSDY